MTHLKKVGKIRLPRSGFNMPYRSLFDCWAGELIPVQCDFCIPGDIISLSQEVVVRTTPLESPALHEIYGNIHRFFVPIRIIDPTFDTSMTGGEDGRTPATFRKYGWQLDMTSIPATYMRENSLFDFLYGVVSYDETPGATGMAAPLPTAWAHDAYKMIWNEYYRDQHLQEEIPESTILIAPLRRNWKKDYFTSARPEAQLGPSTSLPISGTTFADFTGIVPGQEWQGNQFFRGTNEPITNNGGIRTNLPGFNASILQGQILQPATSATSQFLQALSDNRVNLTNVGTYDVNDMRAVFQLQKWQERNMRAGVRYTEFLQARWGVSPRDDRLQRPEFLGSSRFPIVISEVLQTAEGVNPVGELRGHGISANISNMRRYKAQEPGILMSILSIMPKPGYQQGIDRQWLMETRYDIPFPEFTHLGEREILNQEIYAGTNTSINNGIFGFRGIFDEHRSKHDKVHGGMRRKFDYWHLTRKFDGLPQLNSDFITVNGDSPSLMRIFTVKDERPYIVHVGNILKMLRHLPVVAEPGMIDHF